MRRLEEYIDVGQKRLRCGYTTGTCAAAAARAAAELLVRGIAVPVVSVETPAGVEVPIDVEEYASGARWARCAVRKDAGDDPDVTDGVLVVACVEWRDSPGICIEGGEGIGRVTRPGLDQPVGAAAINSTPRRMITEQLEAVLRQEPSHQVQNSQGVACPEKLSSLVTAHGTQLPGSSVPSDTVLETRNHHHHGEGILVTISVPDGETLAERTFNPRLGIEGGISIIGTSGIVKPMSEEAIVRSIELELRMRAAQGNREVLVVPGNYGRDFARDELGLDATRAVSCSNYFGETIDAAARLGFARMLIVGHLGKMAKVAGGIMNTHSRVADCRMEVLAAHAALAGASRETVARVMEAATTDAALDVLAVEGLVDATMASLMVALGEKLSHRAGDALQVEAIVFSNKHGVLGCAKVPDPLAHRERREQ